MGALPVTKLSVEEYLALDRASDGRFEYYDGEVFPVVAGTLHHSLLVTNVGRRFSERLDKTPCSVSTATLRVRVSPTKYLYPDVLVHCGKPILSDEKADAITNPHPYEFALYYDI